MENHRNHHKSLLTSVHRSMPFFRCSGCGEKKVLRDLSKIIKTEECDYGNHMRLCRFSYCSKECQKENYVFDPPGPPEGL
jgi:predicted metal-binding protein